MTKWEYMYIQVYQNDVESINGKRVGEYTGFLQIPSGQPILSEFLEKTGQDGWEVIGICPANENASRWRLVLKRPI
jgi:hypothetical protein